MSAAAFDGASIVFQAIAKRFGSEMSCVSSLPIAYTG